MDSRVDAFHVGIDSGCRQPELDGKITGPKGYLFDHGKILELLVRRVFMHVFERNFTQNSAWELCQTLKVIWKVRRTNSRIRQKSERRKISDYECIILWFE